MMPLGGVPQIVQHEAGLDPRLSAIRIQRDNSVEVLRPVDHDGDIAALTGQARPTAP
jgi:hypothetical protein